MIEALPFLVVSLYVLEEVDISDDWICEVALNFPLVEIFVDFWL